MTVHDLLEQHSHSSPKLGVRLLPPEESERAGYVLIDGDPSALRFFGELLIAIADQRESYDLQLHPSGAGSVHFQHRSDLGFYIRATGHDESATIGVEARPSRRN